MADRVVLLVADRFVDKLSDSISASAPDRTIVPISALLELNAASADGAGLLISMGTSVIVPQAQLGRFSAAYNFHSASPDYPGRDPCHFAIYDGVTRYGATAHVMTSRVDEGPIVGVEWFDVPQNTGPLELMEMANDAAMRLFCHLAPTILLSDRALPPIDVKWGGRKTSRADFLRMCRIPPDIGKDELLRRLRAFDVANRGNLYIDLHGLRFTLDSNYNLRPSGKV